MLKMLTMTIFYISILTATSAHADQAAGVAAMDRGDFASAFKELRPEAEKGDAQAQVQMAYLYFHGKGVPQDYKE